MQIYRISPENHGLIVEILSRDSFCGVIPNASDLKKKQQLASGRVKYIINH